MELVLAAYGAVVSTLVAILGFLHWRSTQTEIRVKPSNVNAPDDLGGKNQIMATIVNRSGHDVLVTHISVLTADKKQAIFWSRPFPTSLPIPIEIPARRYIMAWNPMDESLPEPYQIAIQTADDRGFKSKKFRMKDLPTLSYFDPESA